MPILNRQYRNLASQAPQQTNAFGVPGLDTLDPSKRSRTGQLHNELFQLLGPHQLARHTNLLLPLLQQSAFGQAQRAQSTQLGNSTQQAIATQLGRSGLGGSGAGAIAGGIANTAGQRADLQNQSQLFQLAMEMARQNLMGRMNIAPNMLNAQVGQEQHAASRRDRTANAWGSAFTALAGARLPGGDD